MVSRRTMEATHRLALWEQSAAPSLPRAAEPQLLLVSLVHVMLSCCRYYSCTPPICSLEPRHARVMVCCWLCKNVRHGSSQTQQHTITLACWDQGCQRAYSPWLCSSRTVRVCSPKHGRSFTDCTTWAQSFTPRHARVGTARQHKNPAQKHTDQQEPTAKSSTPFPPSLSSPSPG